MALGPHKNRRREERAARVRKTAVLHGPGLRRLGLGLLAAGVLAFAAVQVDAWAKTSTRFALRTVQASGLHRATEAELLRLAGIGSGQNLWALDAHAVAQAMSAHPWVRSVEVSRGLPDTLHLRIEEHVPAALAALGDLYVLDDQGSPFKKLSAADALDLPIVTGMDRDRAVKEPTQTEARFREALAAAEAYSRAVQEPRLSEVHVEDAGLRLITADGQAVVLGDVLGDEQVQRLARVRAELQHRGLSAAAIHLENRVRPGWVAIQLASALPGRPQH